MKKLKSTPNQNFLLKRILLLTLFVVCYGFSASAQNWYRIDLNTNSSSCSTWLNVEAFDASNNSLGQTGTVSFPSSLGCLPQSGTLDHFDITTGLGCTTSISLSSLTSTPSFFPLTCSCGNIAISMITNTSCFGFTTIVITIN